MPINRGTFQGNLVGTGSRILEMLTASKAVTSSYAETASRLSTNNVGQSGQPVYFQNGIPTADTKTQNVVNWVIANSGSISGATGSSADTNIQVQELVRKSGSWESTSNWIENNSSSVSNTITKVSNLKGISFAAGATRITASYNPTSSQVIINIPSNPGHIGAANASHNHIFAQITDGTDISASVKRLEVSASSIKNSYVTVSSFNNFTQSVTSRFLPITGGTLTGNLETKDVFINGNLTVGGTTTTINAQNLNVKDKLILIASGSTTQAAANGAGIAVSTASVGEGGAARIQYLSSGNRFTSSIAFEAPSFTGSLKGTATNAVSASYSTQAHSSISASYSKNSDKTLSASYASASTTASYALIAEAVKDGASLVVNTASYALEAGTASYNAEAAALRTIITNNSASWAIDNDTKVTSAANHYKATGQISGSQGGTNTTYIHAITLDAAGHVTAVSTTNTSSIKAASASYATRADSAATAGNATSATTATTASYNKAGADALAWITSNSASATTNTDRYVNTAAFVSTGSNGANGVKMTLTRAGSDTARVTAIIPVVSVTAAGVVTGAQLKSWTSGSSWVGANSASIITAVTNNHTHSNKAVLDGITAADTASWDAKQAAISDLATIRTNATSGSIAFRWGNHANAGYVKSSGVTSVTIKATNPIAINSTAAITRTGERTISVASGYAIPTTTQIANFSSATGSVHTHSNKAVLDSITAAKTASWDAAKPGTVTSVTLTTSSNYVVVDSTAAITTSGTRKIDLTETTKGKIESGSSAFEGNTIPYRESSVHSGIISLNRGQYKNCGVLTGDITFTLTNSFGDGRSTIYAGRFYWSPSQGYSVTFPSQVKWLDSSVDLGVQGWYEFNILDNIGIMASQAE